MYIAVHFLGDVVVGLAIGWACSEICLEWLRPRFEPLLSRRETAWSNFLRWGIAILLLGSILRLMIKVYPEDLLQLDQQAFLWLNGLHTNWLDPVMEFVSNKLVWLPVYLILTLWIGRKF
ncbi:MAG: hypothetical protein AAF206_10910, partial [Bacteroidota bacterium]